MYNFIEGNAENLFILPDELRYSKILEDVSEGIIVLNAKWEVLYISKQLMDLTSNPDTKSKANKFQEIFPLFPNSMTEEIEFVKSTKQNKDFNEYLSVSDLSVTGTIYHDHSGIVIVIKELKKADKFYSEHLSGNNVLENLNQALFVIDLENKIHSWNKTAEKLYGWNKDEVIGKKADDLFALRIEGYNTEEFKQMILSNNGWTGEIFQYDKYKSLKIIKLNASPIKNEDATVTGIAFYCKDITKEKENQIELVENHNVYKNAVNSVKEVIFKTDKNGIITFLNNAWEVQTGFSVKESIGQYLTDFRAGDNKESFENLLSHLSSEGKAEFVIKNSDGSNLELLIYANRNIEEGRVIGVSGTMINITDSKVFEKELLRHVKLLKAVSHASGSFLKSSRWQEKISFTLSKIGEAAEVNSCFISRFNTTPAGSSLKIVYQWAAHQYHSQIAQKFEKLDSSIIGNMHHQLEKDIILCNHQSPICEELHDLLQDINVESILILPVFVEDKLWGMVCFENIENDKYWIEAEIKSLKTFSEMLGASITRSQFEKSLIKSKQISENADRLKSEFLAQISHEIRTPINALLSFSNFIGNEFKDRVDEDTRLSFNVIESSGRRIIRTIDLILHMSELQSGSYDFKPVNIDVYEDILNDVYLENFRAAKKKGLSFSILPLTNDTRIKGDVFSITQIFNQLVDNAIKYTKRGSVSIKLFRDSLDRLIIEIKDTGIGISPEYLPKLFELFSQEEQGYTRPYDGNGLGLSLVKRYCELNNAEITVESVKNKGSIFRVQFN